MVQPRPVSDPWASCMTSSTRATVRSLPRTTSSTGQPRWLATSALKSNSSARDASLKSLPSTSMRSVVVVQPPVGVEDPLEQLLVAGRGRSSPAGRRPPPRTTPRRSGGAGSGAGSARCRCRAARPRPRSAGSTRRGPARPAPPSPRGRPRTCHCPARSRSGRRCAPWRSPYPVRLDRYQRWAARRARRSRGRGRRTAPRRSWPPGGPPGGRPRPASSSSGVVRRCRRRPRRSRRGRRPR